MSRSVFSLFISALIFFHHKAVQGQSTCVSTIDALELQESAAGVSDPDYLQPRSYVLCPDKVYAIGSMDTSTNLITDGQQFIRVRPNLALKCGEDGKVTNNCIVTGGDVHVDGTTYFGNKVSSVTNITIEGFTFSNAQKYSVWVTKPGDITFVDCVFSNNTKAIAPIYLDYFDSADVGNELSVAFLGCTFINNVYYGEGASPSIITANGEQNRLTLSRNFFENNDYVFNNTKADRNSFLVESSGPLSMSRNCFLNNTIGVSPVVSYGVHLEESSENYGTESEGKLCQFISSFNMSTQFESFTPSCIMFESNTSCVATTTTSPSFTPTAIFSVAPSAIPSAMPSTVASSSPSVSPSKRGSTLYPSSSPSQHPSAIPTTSDSPSAFPSHNPSTVPTLLESSLPTILDSLFPTILDSSFPTKLDSSFPIKPGSPSAPPSRSIVTSSPNLAKKTFPPINPLTSDSRGFRTVVALIATFVLSVAMLVH